ncbi:bifunctional enoyl-CoA hydratase/phosphate acetyltransferase [Virgibacillus xinjiangensis]|uniref:Bifunctional enoyl-CoA hydratase/phosphate acetyltransferase n=1 Tax=Virgibacillus xinjiangensis TaxID=393090 RepID=A0ABV7CRR9_9BACI
MNTLASLKDMIPNRQKKVAVAHAADQGILRAVKKALELNLCEFLLVGDEVDIAAAAQQAELDILQAGITIRHVGRTESVAGEAVAAVAEEEAQLVMKGSLPTKNLLRAVLDKNRGLRTGKVLSHTALFEIPALDRLLLLSDAALNITPSLKEKEQIIHNSVEVARGIGMTTPKVALLAPVETVDESMQSTMDAALLTQMYRRGQISGCVVDGPLAFDIAISTEAADQKGIVSDVAGKADVLIVPTIEAGNMLYKSFIYTGRAQVASIISGAKVPVVLTSRSDSAQSKLNSLMLGLASADKI